MDENPGPRAGRRAVKGWVTKANARGLASPGSCPRVIVTGLRLVAAAVAKLTAISAA